LVRLVGEGKVHQIPSGPERAAAVVESYMRNPKGAIVIAPDNKSRQELNSAVRAAMQKSGALVSSKERAVTVLVPKQELTAADRKWAAKYETGGAVRYVKGSHSLGIKAGELARVEQVNTQQNEITVRLGSGSTARVVTYDPARLRAVAVYRQEERVLAPRDRVQFTAALKAQKIVNREVGTVQAIDTDSVTVRLDSGRSVKVGTGEPLHLEHGYAVTSYVAQGATQERVLLNVSAENAENQGLVNSRFFYVGVSRARSEAEIFAEDILSLSRAVARQVSKTSAVEALEQGADLEVALHA
jgi:ATP-dependent exoDNAse (exonuclease V) alpha subunit